MQQATLTLTVLGSGTGVPSLERSGPAYLLRCGSDLALVDCGPGTLRRLLRAGIDATELAAVFLTHTHADHLADLIPLLHALLLHHQGVGTPPARVLELYGPVGLDELCRQQLLPLVSAPEHWQKVVQVTEVTRHLQWAGCQVTTATTRHSARLASLAYRFDCGDRSLVLSGDTEDSPALRRLAAGTNLLVLDCSYPDQRKVAGHLSAGECGRLAAGVGAGKVVLSHLYPTPEPAELRVEQCRLYFAGPVLLAQDLLELRI